MGKGKKSVQHTKGLQSLRARIQLMADDANKKASQLSIGSMALQNAKSTRPKSRKGEELFTGELQTLYQLTREAARIQAFEADWRSTKEGDAYYRTEEAMMTGSNKDIVFDQDSAELYRGQFGGQWLTETGETYNTKLINEDFAKSAFDLYRRLVEEKQSEDVAKMLWARGESRSTFDSESMIIALYDMVVRGYKKSDIIDWARERLQSNYVEWQSRQFTEDTNEDYQPLSEDYFSRDDSKAVMRNERRKR